MRPSSGQRYAASARRQRTGIEMARGKVLWFNPVTRVYPALRWPHGRAGRSACRRARRLSDFETWSKVALRGRAWPERENPSRNPKADRLMRPPSTSPPRPLVREHRGKATHAAEQVQARLRGYHSLGAWLARSQSKVHLLRRRFVAVSACSPRCSSAGPAPRYPHRTDPARQSSR